MLFSLPQFFHYWPLHRFTLSVLWHHFSLKSRRLITKLIGGGGTNYPPRPPPPQCSPDAWIILGFILSCCSHLLTEVLLTLHTHTLQCFIGIPLFFNGGYLAFPCWDVFHALIKFTAFKIFFLWSLIFIQPGWPAQSPQNMYFNHLFITVTVILDVPLCQALRHVYPPVISPPPVATREFLIHLPSEERQPHLSTLLTSHLVIILCPSNNGMTLYQSYDLLL